MPTQEEVVKTIGENVTKIGDNVGAVEKKLQESDAVVKTLQEKIVVIEKNAGDKIAALEKMIAAQREQIYATGHYKGKLPNERVGLLAGHYFLATAFADKFPLSKAWLNGEGVAIVKAMGVGSESALVPPTILSNTILDLVESDYGVFRADCFKWPGDPDKVPTKEGNVRVYSPDDGQVITASDLLVGFQNLLYKNWATLSVWTRQLDERSIVAIGELWLTSAAEAIGEKEDECAFIGDGSADYFGVTGMLNAVGSAGVVETINASLNDLEKQDFLNVMLRCPKRHRKIAKWYGESTILAYCYGAKDAAGRQSIESLRNETGDLPLLLNKPVEEVACMPDASEVTAGSKFLIFGSVRNSGVIAQRSDIIIERSTEFGFASHTQAIKSYETKAIKIVRAGTSTKVGAYVVLKLKA